MFIGRREYLADLETLWRKRPVLVYAGELAKSVEADGFFDTILPARRLLGMENGPRQPLAPASRHAANHGTRRTATPMS